MTFGYNTSLTFFILGMSSETNFGEFDLLDSNLSNL